MGEGGVVRVMLTEHPHPHPLILQINSGMRRREKRSQSKIAEQRTKE